MALAKRYGLVRYVGDNRSSTRAANWNRRDVDTREKKKGEARDLVDKMKDNTVA